MLYLLKSDGRIVNILCVFSSVVDIFLLAVNFNSDPIILRYIFISFLIVPVITIYLNANKKHTEASILFILICYLYVIGQWIFFGAEYKNLFFLATIAGMALMFFTDAKGYQKWTMAVLSIPLYTYGTWHVENYFPIIQLDTKLLNTLGYINDLSAFVVTIITLGLFTKEKNKYANKMKESRDQLDLINKEMKNFNYMATHDLKAPLNNLEGLHTYLGKYIQDDNKEKAKMIVDLMGKSIEQGQNTVESLSNIMKFKNVSEDSEDLFFQELLDEILINEQVKINEYNVEIIADFANCPTIHYGRITVKSTIQNLVSNAIKYHSSKRLPKISISTYKTKKYICFQVTDNGIGIDLENKKEELFGLFKRIQTDKEGTGIGLNMIKNKLEISGGKLEVSSEIDKGSTFTAYFKY